MNRENGDVLVHVHIKPGHEFSSSFSAKIASKNVNLIYPGRGKTIKTFNKSWSLSPQKGQNAPF